jgi:hypothetical protein
MRKFIFWTVLTALILGGSDVLANSVFSGNAGPDLPLITNAL